MHHRDGITPFEGGITVDDSGQRQRRAVRGGASDGEKRDSLWSPFVTELCITPGVPCGFCWCGFYFGSRRRVRLGRPARLGEDFVLDLTRGISTGLGFHLGLEIEQDVFGKARLGREVVRRRASLP